MLSGHGFMVVIPLVDGFMFVVPLFSATHPEQIKTTKALAEICQTWRAISISLLVGNFECQKLYP